MRADEHTTPTPLPINSATAPSHFVATTPFDAERIGAAAIYCSDGRYGDQMDEFLHQGLGLPRYDRVAIPGGSACLAPHVTAMRERGALDNQMRFLIEAHALHRVVLIAHEDCGFYKRLRLRVTIEEQQRIDLAVAAAKIREAVRGTQVDAYLARKVAGRVRFENVPVD